jgi:hypothetical protein
VLSLFKIHHSKFCSAWAWRVKARAKAAVAGSLASLPRHAGRQQQYPAMRDHISAKGTPFPAKSAEIA